MDSYVTYQLYLSELGEKTIWHLYPHIRKDWLPAVPRAKEVIIVIRATTKREWFKKHENSSNSQKYTIAEEEESWYHPIPVMRY